MNAEILSVGTELLLGQIVNTDAQYLSQKLSGLGINVYYHITVGDNRQRLIDALKSALQRSDLIIATGGLGPTMDDITKETIAECMDIPMELDEDSLVVLKGWFERFGRPMTDNNIKQAVFPVGCRILPNRKGTAPGCIIEKDGKTVIILPGPPFELIDMYEQQVQQYLLEKSGSFLFSRVLRIYGIGESDLETRIRDLMEAQSNPTIAPYAGFGEVTLRITARCENGEDPEKYIRPVEEEIRRRVGLCCYGTDDHTLDWVVADLLVQHKKKFAIAESCTGGMVVSQLINYPGISQALAEGLVTYSNESKIKRLGVKPETIAQYGAVSEQVAQEMAQGLLRDGVDLAVSVTGIAGPDGGTEQKPTGLVYIGIATPQSTKVIQMQATGDRDRVRKSATLRVLDTIRRAMIE